MKKFTTVADSNPVRQQTRPGEGTIREERRVTIRTCGFAFTTTGRPCANHVGDDELYCRAGHPCATGMAQLGRLDVGDWTSPHRRTALGVPLERPTISHRGRRAMKLLARSLAHEDAEADGVCADRVLADPAIALALLGSPDAAPAARDAVVQRFGLVGAFLVVGHEDRWHRRLAVVSGNADATVPGDEVSVHLERLIKHFGHLDVHKLAVLLNDIDRAENGVPDDDVAVARHRLHAAYAVAARDGSEVSHHEYMESLNEVLSMTRPAVAS
ncbi:MAG TPA: hypothetical protein VNC61_02020 [Acidimicrobiales bacterium]|nr:hypothetical protein [Acidimicrobiales bacterium]